MTSPIVAGTETPHTEGRNTSMANSLSRFVQFLRGEDSANESVVRKITSTSFLSADERDAPESPPIQNRTSSPVGTSLDQHFLLLMQARVDYEGRRTGAAIGGGIGGICLLPFGPIAMCICGIGGMVVGFGVGVFSDLRRARIRANVAGKELRRLTNLVRFASDQISRRLFIHSSPADSAYCMSVLESVILEFKPYVEVAHLSPTLRKKLRLFHSFLTRDGVKDALWLYVNDFLTRWTTSLTVAEFTRVCTDVLLTLVKLERALRLIDFNDRLEVIVRVEQFLNQSWIKDYTGAPLRAPGGSSQRNLEAVLVRDLHMILRKDSKKPRNRRESMGSIASAHTVRESDELDYLDILNPTAQLIEEELASPISAKPRSSFFWSFKDFMDFDLDLKHKMPIAASEAQFLYEKEAEPLDGPGWELTVNRGKIKVLRFLPKESANDDVSSSAPTATPAVLVRAYASIPNTSINNVFYHIYDTARRQTWDTNFSQISLLDQPAGSSACEVIYCVLNSPFGVTPRDFLQYRLAILEPGVISIIMRSADHPGKPAANGTIRAETYISGYVMRQNGDDCELFLMSQTDIKGLIPKWIVNMMAAKAPAQWIDNLIKSCNSLRQKQFKGDEAAMTEFLNAFVQSKTTVTA